MPAKSKRQIAGANNSAMRYQQAVDNNDDNFTEDFNCVSFDDPVTAPLPNSSSLKYFEGAGALLSRTYGGDSKRTQSRKYRVRAPKGNKLITVYIGYRGLKPEAIKKVYRVSNGEEPSVFDADTLDKAVAAVENSVTDPRLATDDSDCHSYKRPSHAEYTAIIDSACGYLSDKRLMEFEKIQVRAIIAYFQGLRAGQSKREISTTISSVSFLRGPYMARVIRNWGKHFQTMRTLPPGAQLGRGRKIKSLLADQDVAAECQHFSDHFRLHRDLFFV
ncbi:hypothetical protein V1525DRAFT_459217 [Lipomyces kononenkoae]|uniref:Uncharacterized protein n=1 Tax=Lipomyces kononenkoae TaxID=34357 RepID=A0ACC3STF4_LIPKO